MLLDDLAGKLPKGEYTFRFTILNGEVKVISVNTNGQELSDKGKAEMPSRRDP